MKSHLRSLRGNFLTALLLITILAAAAPVAAFEPIAERGTNPPVLPVLAAEDLHAVADRPSSTEVASNVSDATARPDPLQTDATVGQTFVVNMYLQDVANLYAVDIHLSFDPSILEVQDVNPDIPGIQIQPLESLLVPGFVIKRKACNAPDPSDPDCNEGGLAWYAASQLNPSPPVTGSGPLAAITFKALKAGVSPLEISYHQLSDSTGTPIPSTYLHGAVDVADVALVYLPIIYR